MKRIVWSFALCALALIATSAWAQDKPLGIKGSLSINYKTRTQVDEAGKPQPGVKDAYAVNLDVAETMNFAGSIEYLPTLFTSLRGAEKQGAQLTYNLALAVRNPANLQQTRTVGKLVGTVPIDKNGVYQYDSGNLRMAIEATGRAAGFESRFRGTAAGKPPKNTSTAARAKKQAETLKRQVQGKTISLVVTDYDKMTFNGLVLPAGPVQAYPEAQVSGEMIYDYERNVWYFNGVTLTYQGADGKTATDKIGGNIKWVESPQRKVNGEGQYEFDIRVNEPEEKGTEAAAFQPSTDESAFFAVDKTLASLTGTAKYKDTMRGETVSQSEVAIDLTGNKLNKPQVLNLAKLVWLVCVVPMNAE